MFMITSHFRPDHHTANMDIIQRLRTFWRNDLGTVVKVKAHQDPSLLINMEQKWHAMGNDLADRTAKAARDNDMDDVLRLSRILRQHNDVSFAESMCLWEFFKEISRFRLHLLDQKQPSNDPAQFRLRATFIDAFGQAAVEYLATWPTIYIAVYWMVYSGWHFVQCNFKWCNFC